MGQKAGSGEGEEVLASLDMRLPSSKLRYMVYVLGEQLSQIPLTDRFPKAEYGADKAVKGSIEMSAAGVSLFGHPAQLGKNTLEGFERFKGVDFFLVSTQVAQTKFMRLNAKDYFILGGSDSAAVHTPDTSRIILHENSATVEVGSDFVYFNSQRLTDFAVIKEMHPGDTLLTPSLLLERRPSQWKLTVFRPEEIIWHHKAFLEQEGLSEFPQDFPDYRRSPRLNLERPTDQLKLQKIEAPEAPNKNGLLKAILPPIGMLAVSVVMAVISGRNPLMMLGMGFMSVMTAIFTITQYMTEKKERQTANRQREEDYEVYLLGAVADISEKYAEEKRVLDYKSPSPERLTEMMTQYDPRIYERMRPNKDFLEVSLGLGTQASSLTVEAEATARDHDEASERIKMLASRFSSQKDSPVTLNLLGQTLGFIGNDEVLKTAVANLLLQLAFFHSYRDVNFISLVPEKSYATDWMGWRFLPHVKIQDLNIRGLVHNAKTRDMILNSFLQILNQRKQIVKEAGKEIPTFSPHYLLTLFDDSYLAGHGLNEFLAEDMSELGVTVIWCKEDQKLLPETVTALVSYQNQGAGQILNDHQVYVAKDFVPYPKTEGLETALRTLANLNHVEVEKNAIPESLSLLAQYEVKTIPELKISERWALAEPNKSIKSLIGWRGKSDAVYWDLHERVHGPHALVGGTTGSGKSEFLTTFLIGLAINFSPEDIGMLIIDWKGGGIANTLDKLPHFMGAITNLDGAGTARALASIKAELDKRMLEFAKYGVNNINGYMSLYKQRQDKDRNPEISYPDQPIPHLILVSDEFAELKSNVPEFLDELTSVARIGRSLGVHLILATQKPSGVVNDQIEANSTSKIALKMASEQDSSELLKTADAAHITQPGRGYLKVGQNEVYELFQSGYAGVPYDPEAISEEVIDERLYLLNDFGQTEPFYDPGEAVSQGRDRRELPTQLEAVITEIGKVFEHSNLRQPAKPWLPNLETRIVSPEMTEKETRERNLNVPLGLMDIPSQQTQEIYTFDLEARSHTAIFSSPGYGKSTTLQTLVMNLARQNTPEQIQFYLLDFGNNGLLPLKNLPHVIDITTADNVEKTDKMLGLIQNEVTRRKRQFTQLEVSTLEQYNRQAKESLPIQLVIVDAYDTVAEGQDRDKYDTLFSQLLREGAALGLYLIMTANRIGAIRMNMLSNIQTKIALYLLNKDELTTLFGRERLESQSLFGRGQLRVEQVQAIQIYLPVHGESETELYANLSEEIHKIDEDWKGSRPQGIPMVPEEVKSIEFFEEKVVKNALSRNLLPIGYQKENAMLFSINLQDEDYFGIISDDKIKTEKMVRRIFEAFERTNQSSDLVIFESLNWLKQVDIPTNVTIVRETVKDYTSEAVTEGVEIPKEEKIATVEDEIEAEFLATFSGPISSSSSVPVQVQVQVNEEKLKDKIVLILNPEEALNGMTSLEDMKAFEKSKYLILISDPAWLSKITDISKYFRANLRYGLLLKRLSEQTIITNNAMGREAELLSGEAYAFRGRDIRKLRLTQVANMVHEEREF